MRGQIAEQRITCREAGWVFATTIVCKNGISHKPDPKIMIKNVRMIVGIKMEYAS